MRRGHARVLDFRAVIHVRLYGGLSPADEPGTKELHVAARPGLTVAELLRQAGIAADSVRVVVVDGQAARLDSPLGADAQVALFPAVAGG